MNDGGPAFPAYRECWPRHGDRPHLEAVPGMTLRDYFAAAAMQPYVQVSLDSEPQPGDTPDVVCARFARFAYKMADAMLEAREATDES